MMKLLGAVLIIGVSSLGGFIWAEKLSDRCELLKEWLRVLELLQTEIYYQGRLLPEIFRRVSENGSASYLGEMFRKAADQLEFGSGRGVADVWEGLALARSGLLQAADLRALLELGGYLGSTDRCDQLNKIKACKAHLELQLREAEQKRTMKTSLYRYLGFALGAAVVLWLL